MKLSNISFNVEPGDKDNHSHFTSFQSIAGVKLNQRDPAIYIQDTKMPDFSELFEKANWQPIEYKDQTVIRLDKFPVKDGDQLLIRIEKANSDCRQGLCIDITGHCEMDGKTFKKGKGIRMLFWEDTSPKEIRLKIFTKGDFVWVENIWEQTSHTGMKSVDYGRYGSAMIVEEIENGRRYRCNDWHPDDNFDDIVFTVQKS